jgi:hypothetical protein
MKCTTVSINEIQADNPTMCLSVNRILGNCHKCYKFKYYFNSNDSVKQTINKMPCNPKLNKDVIVALNEKKKLIKHYKKKLASINKRLE